MCITWPRVCFSIHLLWCISYTLIGTIQVIVGVFFFALSFLKLCSNIWIGILNIIFGIGGAVYAMVGTWSLGKQRTFLYMAISVLIANIINLVLLEVGEWHLLLPENAKKLIEQGNGKMLWLYARTIASLSTVVAALIAFVDSQITFCSMQYHERYHKKSSAKHDIMSDTEFVLPRVKSDSDENENATYFNKQHGQSWVYKTSTAESSTANSVPNRYSGTSSDNLIDSKPTPGSEAEFKDISTTNLNMEQPVVVVENTSDYTDRQLHYMTSFSRTPSPVPASDSSSENSCSVSGPQLQERLKKVIDQTPFSTDYRSRLDSSKSTGAIAGGPSPTKVSPRPPSISEGVQARHDSLTTADFQETTSQRSFKISADQIFIPLKDETVIRINDEVFVTPNKPRRPSPQEEQPCPAKATAKAESRLTPSPRESKTVSFPSLVTSKLAAHAEKAISPTSEKLKSALPEVVDVIRKELIQKKSCPPQPPPPTPQTEEQPSYRTRNPPAPIEIIQPAPPPDSPPDYPLVASARPGSPVEQRSAAPVFITKAAEDSLEEAMRRYLSTPLALPSSPDEPPQPSAAEERLELSASSKDPTVPSPTLERQTKIERDDTMELENEPYMFSRSQFDRQDTVIAVDPAPPPAKLPTPTSDRQTFMERQDAIISPRENQSYILPLPQEHELDSFPSPIETEASLGGETEDELRGSGDEVESNYSNNASTDDKETIVDFKDSDDDLEAVANGGLEAEEGGRECGSDVCDMQRQLGETSSEAGVGRSLGNEIDDIFKIAEDPRLQDDDDEEGGVRDRDDAELFNVNSQSDEICIENIPPPELDAANFEIIPPPEETDDGNGVDPDEWEESDDDSMNSNCVRRIPPPSTSTD